VFLAPGGGCSTDESRAGGGSRSSSRGGGWAAALLASSTGGWGDEDGGGPRVQDRTVPVAGSRSLFPGRMRGMGDEGGKERGGSWMHDSGRVLGMIACIALQCELPVPWACGLVDASHGGANLAPLTLPCDSLELPRRAVSSIDAVVVTGSSLGSI